MSQQTFSQDYHPQAPKADSAGNWWRTQAATMALLKHANGMAEKRIAELERKIRELEDLAATDSLTGLMNRRGFERFFDNERARIRRGHFSGAVFALLDLDGFKKINDTHGHQTGDECLKRVADELLASIRETDGAARLGGDEFALLLAQTDLEKIGACIEKIQKRLEEIAVGTGDKTLHLGASVGVAAISESDTFSEAYQRADKALYRDKTRRKNL